MAARLFIGHQYIPDIMRTQIVACLSRNLFRGRRFQSGNKSFAQKPLLGIPAVRIESKANDRFAIAHDISDDRHHAGRHL